MKQPQRLDPPVTRIEQWPCLVSQRILAALRLPQLVTDHDVNDTLTWQQGDLP